jgi:hypothetical protein
VRIEPPLQDRLRRRAALARKSESVVVREALEKHLAEEPKALSAYDIALQLGAVGCARNLPPDLSTNRKHMEGFGEGFGGKR